MHCFLGAHRPRRTQQILVKCIIHHCFERTHRSYFIVSSNFISILNKPFNCIHTFFIISYITEISIKSFNKIRIPLFKTINKGNPILNICFTGAVTHRRNHQIKRAMRIIQQTMKILWDNDAFSIYIRF